MRIHFGAFRSIDEKARKNTLHRGGDGGEAHREKKNRPERKCFSKS